VDEEHRVVLGGLHALGALLANEELDAWVHCIDEVVVLDDLRLGCGGQQ
jgi:hypothetical protein